MIGQTGAKPRQPTGFARYLNTSESTVRGRVAQNAWGGMAIALSIVQKYGIRA